MNKKVLLASSVVGVLLIAAFVGYRSYTKTFSPEAVALYEGDSLTVRVQYCRPAKKGRLIFGREQDNALVPYDKVWRTGANEATLITFSRAVRVAGHPVKAGTYSLWTIPGPARWEIVLNQETGQWGTEYNDGMDLFRAQVPIRIDPSVTENFRIYFEETPTGPNLILDWDQTEAIIPIRGNYEL
jgi:hypothetical protein